MSQAPRTQAPPCLDTRPAGRGDGKGDLERIIGSIGLKVFSLRKRMGLSLQQLGERSDVSAAAIHKIEQGGMVPTITTLLKIAGALGRPVSYFVEEEVGQERHDPHDPSVSCELGNIRPGRSDSGDRHGAPDHLT